MRELVAVIVIWVCTKMMGFACPKPDECAEDGGFFFAFFLVVWMVAVLFLILALIERARGDDSFRINPGVPPLPELYSESDNNDNETSPPPRQ